MHMYTHVRICCASSHDIIQCSHDIIQCCDPSLLNKQVDMFVNMAKVTLTGVCYNTL